ncbi:AI-2E family transporter [Paracoccus rhizosphaerae]|uniref:AI-2E family transporter n=1 Tax=Paracoccus rhizosphaerae TaxID=1133347 RepID=A0ABV6CJY6_9RHOB|nr:AI-2E family transporter [Paracoccus rhizosphaerae]
MTDPRQTPPARPQTASGAGIDRALTNGTLFRTALLLLLLGAALAWSHVLLLVFGSILVAIAMRAGGNGLHRLMGLPVKLGVILVVVAVIGVVAGGIWLAGSSIGAQFRDLLDALPQSWDALTGWLPGDLLGETVEDQLPQDVEAGAERLAERLPDLMGLVTGAVNTVLGSLSSVLLMLITAVYLAMEARLYRDGAIRLVPLRHRGRALEITDELGGQLARWMAGQALDMVVVAILAGLGLWLLGVPLTLILALIAGVTNIVPIVGPVFSGAIAVLVALPQGVDTALYVALLFLAIQTFEGDVLMPLIQRYAVQLPPALTIVAIVAFGGLFGFVGVVLATPLLIVALLLIRRLYVQDTLGDPDVE